MQIPDFRTSMLRDQEFQSFFFEGLFMFFFSLDADGSHVRTARMLKIDNRQYNWQYNVFLKTIDYQNGAAIATITRELSTNAQITNFEAFLYVICIEISYSHLELLVDNVCGDINGLANELSLLKVSIQKTVLYLSSSPQHVIKQDYNSP